MLVTKDIVRIFVKRALLLGGGPPWRNSPFKKPSGSLPARTCSAKETKLNLRYFGVVFQSGRVGMSLGLARGTCYFVASHRRGSDPGPEKAGAADAAHILQ